MFNLEAPSVAVLQVFTAIVQIDLLVCVPNQPCMLHVLQQWLYGFEQLLMFKQKNVRVHVPQQLRFSNIIALLIHTNSHFTDHCRTE